jgi:hypothetical protein
MKVAITTRHCPIIVLLSKTLLLFFLLNFRVFQHLLRVCLGHESLTWFDIEWGRAVGSCYYLALGTRWFIDFDRRVWLNLSLSVILRSDGLPLGEICLSRIRLDNHLLLLIGSCPSLWCPRLAEGAPREPGRIQRSSC